MHTDQLIPTRSGTPVSTLVPGSVLRRKRRAPSEQALTCKDIDVLGWLACQYAGRVDHLQRLLGCGDRQTQRVIARLRAHDLVACERILVREPPWVLPTATGLRLSATGFRVWPPNVVMLGHIAAVNQVRLHIEERSPDGRWVSERQLARKEGTKKHLADGVVQLDGQSIAIEVELTAKSRRRTAKIIETLVKSYDTVLYYAAAEPYEILTELNSSKRWPTLGIRELPTTVGDRS